MKTREILMVCQKLLVPDDLKEIDNYIDLVLRQVSMRRAMCVGLRLNAGTAKRLRET